MSVLRTSGRPAPPMLNEQVYGENHDEPEEYFRDPVHGIEEVFAGLRIFLKHGPDRSSLRGS
jgi:hypothetical protein